MIAYIKGKLTEKTPTEVIVEANGIGYSLQISLNTFSKIEALEEARLHTYLHLSVGQASTVYAIYGFFDLTERQMFEHLIGVSGIGANTARLMLSAATASEISQAIVGENLTFFKKIKGIGEKTAKLLIVSLKDKMLKESFVDENSTGSLFVSPGNNLIREEAMSALVALGFQKIPIQKMLNAILKENPSVPNAETLIKLALARM